MSNLSYRRHRFPVEIIQHAVWLYFRFPLSFRDVEDLLAERGIDVSYETVRRWSIKFGLAWHPRVVHAICWRHAGRYMQPQERYFLATIPRLQRLGDCRVDLQLA